jgi:5-methylcytosine-specific restriction endonuclease McrA
VKGKRIAVLEARLGRQLAELVEGRGGVPFHAPALAEIPDLDAGAAAAFGRALDAGRARAGFLHRAGTQALFKATMAWASRCDSSPSSRKPLSPSADEADWRATCAKRIDHSAADPYTTQEVLAAIGEMPLKGSGDRAALRNRNAELTARPQRAAPRWWRFRPTAGRCRRTRPCRVYRRWSATRCTRWCSPRRAGAQPLAVAKTLGRWSRCAKR